MPILRPPWPRWWTDPHLLNLASGTGGEGAAGVREFYATKLIGQFFPPDVEFISISRTMGSGAARG
jgi:hypothetical protein